MSCVPCIDARIQELCHQGKKPPNAIFSWNYKSWQALQLLLFYCESQNIKWGVLQQPSSQNQMVPANENTSNKQKEWTCCWSVTGGWLALRGVTLNTWQKNSSPLCEMRFLAHPDPFILHHLLCPSLLQAAPSPPSASARQKRFVLLNIGPVHLFLLQLFHHQYDLFS